MTTKPLESNHSPSEMPPSSREQRPGGLVIWIGGPLRERAELARTLRKGLDRSGHLSIILAAEPVREAADPNYPSTREGDLSFQRMLASLATLISDQGFVVVVAAASLSIELELARSLAPRFIEVLVDPSLDEEPARASGVRRCAMPATGEAQASDGPDVITRGKNDSPAVPWLLDQVARRVA